MEVVELLPKDTFIVTKAMDSNFVPYDTLTMLYQPIIGIEAYALLMMLWMESEKETLPHTVILNSLNLSIPKLLELRHKLEGIGLLRTFELNQETYHTFIYELQKPLTAAAFFKDDILSTLLLTTVGEERFLDLAHKFTQRQGKPQNYREITADFGDMYQFSEFYLNNYQATYAEAQKLTATPQNIKLTPKATQDVNFEVLIHALNPRIVDLASVRANKETIITLQRLYNLDLETLINYIMQAADTQTGKITRESFQKVVSRVKQKQVEIKTQGETDTSWQKANFAPALKAMFEVASTAAPLEFLESIKEQLGGQVTSTEFYTLRNAVGRSKLSTGVINVVVYYLLINQNYQELPQQIFDKILDRLGQAKLQRIADVWQELPNLWQKLQTKSTKQVKTSKKTIEPEWRKERKRKEVKSEIDLADLKQQLQDF